MQSSFIFILYFHLLFIFWFMIENTGKSKKTDGITLFFYSLVLPVLTWRMLCVHVWLRRLLITHHCLCAVGPWFIGEVLAGRIGACFVFGFIVSGTFVPTVLTYAYGAAQVSCIRIHCLYDFMTIVYYYSAQKLISILPSH